VYLRLVAPNKHALNRRVWDQRTLLMRLTGYSNPHVIHVV